MLTEDITINTLPDGYDVLQMALAEFRRTLLQARLQVPDKITFRDHGTWDRIRSCFPAGQQVEFDNEHCLATINICGIDCVFAPQLTAHPTGKVTI